MRSLIAVLAGAVVAAVLFQIGAAVAFVALYGMPLGAPAVSPSPGYFILNLSFAGFAALVAGRLAARLARQAPLVHAAVLGCILGAIAWWGFTGPASQWPAWYAPTLALVGVAGTLAGGLLQRSRAAP